MRASPGLMTTIAVSLLAVSANAQEGVRWQPTLEAAKQVAGQSNQLVLIHFWAPYCTYCRKMEQEVLTQPPVAATLRANYVPVKLNAEYFPSVVREYGVTKLPTDVIITPQGQLVHKLEGMPRTQDYLSQLNQVAAARSQASPPVLAQMSASPPNNSQPPSASPSMGDGRYADYYRQRNPYAGPPAPAGPAAPPQNPLPQSVPPAVANANPTGGPPAPAGAQMPDPSRETPAASTAGVPQGPSPADPGPGYAGVPGPNGPRIASNQPLLAGGNIAAHPPAHAPVKGAAPTGRQVVLPSGSPPLCLDGYCPVQLVESHRWVPGDTRWGVIHQGRTYLFAGQEEQRRFLSGNGDAYAPVMSGLDVVMAVERREQVPGSLHYGGFFANRVYLFASEETLQKFSQRPEYYVQALRTTANAAYQR